MQQGEVVPAVSAVLGWQVEGFGVGGSRGVECEALDVDVLNCNHDHTFAPSRYSPVERDKVGGVEWLLPAVVV